MPIRTCIGCRREREKSELIRLVRHEGRVVIDYRAKLPGRAAYVCPKLSCIKGAMRRRRLARALKSDLPLDYQDLPEEIAREIKRQIFSLLGLGARAGRVVSGWNGVRAAKGRLELILVAEDASENALRRFARSDRAFVMFTKEELGRAIGRPPRSVLGLTDPELAARLELELERYSDVRGREHGHRQGRT
ncbi:TPA: DUF448 domain-containing protein [Candidatus Bipolaricaulota bacterium]|nr:DUF448 domain-containing protein [Candidatus Bipolaricaulota bacterium]